MGWTWLGESGGLPGALRSDDEFTVESDGVVLDEVTGLRWQRCTIHQAGDDCGASFADEYNVIDLPGLCEATYGAGWRVPRVDELATLVDHGESTMTDNIAAIAPEAFPNTDASYYWTSTRLPMQDGEDTLHRSAVEFEHGPVSRGFDSGGGLKHVRCVLDGADGEIGARFGADPAAADEVQDLRSGLVWRRCAEGQEWSGSTCTGDPDELTVEQADVACTGSWRLPGIRELFSITNHCFHEPALDPDAFPGAAPGLYGESWYWSSTVGFHPVEEIRWAVFMAYGGTENAVTTEQGPWFVRCVRDL